MNIGDPKREAEVERPLTTSSPQTKPLHIDPKKVVREITIPEPEKEPVPA
jgi:hypothetical protein